MKNQHDFDVTTDVFRGSLARAGGVVTTGQLRGPMFRRLFQDVYVHRDVPVTHELRCRGAALIVPPQAVLTGRSAATVYGVPLAAPYDPVEFVVPERHRFGPIKGLHVRRTEVRRQESHAWQGIRIARPRRMTLDLLLRHSPRVRGWVRRLRIAVPDLDAVCRAGLVQPDVLERLGRQRRNRGIVFARHAVEFVDSRAESPRESEVRVILNHAGIFPRLQHNVWEHGRFLGRLDMSLEEAKVAVEYDGRWHQQPRQQLHDHRRRSRLITAGWRFVVLTAEDLAGPWEDIVAEVRAAITPPARTLQLAG